MEDPATMPATESHLPEAGQSLMGLWQVFYEPTAFFTKMKDNPKIMWAWIMSTLLIIVFMAGAADIIAQIQLDAARAQGQNIPDNIPMAYVKIPIIIFSGLAFGILPLIYAGIAMFWGNFVFAGQVRFKQLLCVSVYALLIYSFGSLLHLPLVLAKESMTVTFSPGVLVADQGMQSLAFVALSKFGVFNIWEYFAFSIGVGVMYGFKNKNGYIIGLLTLGLISALHVLSTWIGAGMSAQIGG
jgi:hypothetical protein